MSEYSGLLTVGASGFEITVYDGILPEVDEAALVTSFVGGPNKEPGELHTVIVPRQMRPSHEKIGFVVANENYEEGRYDVDYRIDADYRRRGITLAAAKQLTAQIVDLVPDFKSLDFLISPDNQASLSLASRLGAKVEERYHSNFKLRLTAEQYLEAMRAEAMANV